jgi:hypothetical protein
MPVGGRRSLDGSSSVGGSRSVGGGGNGGEGKIWKMGGNFGNESEMSTTRVFNFFLLKNERKKNAT